MKQAVKTISSLETQNEINVIAKDWTHFARQAESFADATEQTNRENYICFSVLHNLICVCEQAIRNANFLPPSDQGEWTTDKGEKITFAIAFADIGATKDFLEKHRVKAAPRPQERFQTESQRLTDEALSLARRAERILRSASDFAQCGYEIKAPAAEVSISAEINAIPKTFAKRRAERKGQR
jgi:hypothetical protein